MRTPKRPPRAYNNDDDVSSNHHHYLSLIDGCVRIHQSQRGHASKPLFHVLKAMFVVSSDLHPTSLYSISILVASDFSKRRLMEKKNIVASRDCEEKDNNEKDHNIKSEKSGRITFKCIYAHRVLKG
ncbi:hypothetical protein Fot_41885 [Forsythia ovata]|uniref:Uncharacterized protein n=1 Tax=Forsythia ovata TaxID=205694 RepID=A0ABD1RJM9_9LAMI